MASSNSGISLDTEKRLAEFVGQFYDDPLGFVKAMFPWGEETLPNGNPNPLKNWKGPEPWQAEMLEALGQHIKENQDRKDLGLDMKVWRSAIGSGHGVGKSAFTAWIIYFLMSTRVDTRGAVTASTQFQLEDKTWPELAKWHNLALNRHWFIWTATTFSFAAYAEDKRKNYRTTAASVSEHNTEAFQGLHNEGRTVFVLFDEASGVTPGTWEVADGALTDGEAFFFAFGNMTKPEGEFVDCFEKHADLYYTRNIDSRDVSHTNKSALNDIIKKYGGVDSDEVKVRIRGLPPSQSYNGFISVDAVQDAMGRDVLLDRGEALIMAIDVARFGDDETVFGFRRGRDARTIPMKTFKGLKTTLITELAAQEANKYRPDAIVIESTGPGAGVIDQLRDRGFKVIEQHPGSMATNFQHYKNKRAEWWGRMRDWLYEEGCIEDNPSLYQQLTTMNYTLDGGEQKIMLESKNDMKKNRGLPSPDRADTLALTFAVKVARRDRNNAYMAKRQRTSLMQEELF